MDLGEDLLSERTALLRAEREAASAEPGSSAPPPFDPSDAIESAQILVREGLLEEAKKTIRRVMLHNPGNLTAKALLAEIHDQELQQIFSEHQPGGRLQRRRSRVHDPLAGVDPALVLRNLDTDLRLGLAEEFQAQEAVSARGLFPDLAALERFSQKLELDLKELAPRDRMDVGIAFMEMGIPEVAVRQFEAVIELCRRGSEPDTANELVAVSLMAGAYLGSGRPYEAMQTVERYLSDTDVPEVEKIHLMYLMGRALEAASRGAEAVDWFARVTELEPGYRDAAQRQRDLLRGASDPQGDRR
ncbi:MAG: hypothetical protein IT285_00410 [Bdellovibrionales bacterium]|nr:hypothetical protein [Bdellovibrionales bacterium]